VTDDSWVVCFKMATNYTNMKVEDPKDLLRASSLPVSGDLVSRLQQAGMDMTRMGTNCNRSSGIPIPCIISNANCCSRNPSSSAGRLSTDFRKVIHTLHEIPRFKPSSAGKAIDTFQPYTSSPYVQQSQMSTPQRYGTSTSSQYISSLQPPSSISNYNIQNNSLSLPSLQSSPTTPSQIIKSESRSKPSEHAGPALAPKSNYQITQPKPESAKKSEPR
jgi:hypothetical protein